MLCQQQQAIWNKDIWERMSAGVQETELTAVLEEKRASMARDSKQPKLVYKA